MSVSGSGQDDRKPQASVPGGQPPQEAPQQQGTAQGGWSLLGNMQNKQLLAFIVAIDDAKAVMDRLRTMKPGPSLHLPTEVQCMNIWQVLQGSVQQQRVSTFGRQQWQTDRATAPKPAVGHAAHQGPGTASKDDTARAYQQQLQQETGILVQSTAKAKTAAADTPAGHISSFCMSSSEPFSIKNGVRFISCAAGHQHSAAAAEGGYVFTWGCADKGQCGVDPETDMPIAIHMLQQQISGAGHVAGIGAAATAAAAAASTALAAAATKGPVCAAASCSKIPVTAVHCSDCCSPQNKMYSQTAGSRNVKKIESLIALAGNMNLPDSLITGLVIQRKKELEEQEEQQTQDQQVLEEQLQLQHDQAASMALFAAAAGTADTFSSNVLQPGHNWHGTTQQLNAKHRWQQHQPHHSYSGPGLAVYRLNVGQQVHSVACGARHTLVALASSGLMAFGDNDKGQLGAPVSMYKQAMQPIRVRCFDGQRLSCISAGVKHSAAVQEGGVVVCWGHGRYGRLGVGGCPDVLPPSVVSALRSYYTVQVACGSAHTLALTADGKVFAWGYNGQGALGVEDQQDRLVPTLIPGLDACTQVAAAACSMALDCNGLVYQWGGPAHFYAGSSSNKEHPQKQQQLLQEVDKTGVEGNSAYSSTSPAVATAAAVVNKGNAGIVTTARRMPVPWLASLQVVQIACGIGNAVALTTTGKLLLWGRKDNLPASMLQRAQTLGAASSQAAKTGSHQQQLDCKQQVGIDTAADADCNELWVHVMLAVQPDGSLKLSLSCKRAVQGKNTDESHRSLRARAAADGPTAQPAARGSFSQILSRNEVNPALEQVQQMSCGEAHHVMLCQPSQYAPTTDELRAAVVAVLQAYIDSYLGRSISTFQAFMRQQAQAARSVADADGDNEGSTASGITKKSRVKKPPAPVVIALNSGVGTQLPGEAASTSKGTAAAEAAHSPTAASQSGSKGVGYAASSAAKGAGRIGSVTGSASMAKSSSVQPGNAADATINSPVAQPAELGLHGICLLCREVGLVDNITEYADIKRVFQLMLHRKVGRLGPAASRSPPANGLPTSADHCQPVSRLELQGNDMCQQITVETRQPHGSTGNTVVQQRQRQQPMGQAAKQAAAAVSSSNINSTNNTKEPDVLKVVHVIRPGVPVGGNTAGDAAVASNTVIAANAAQFHGIYVLDATEVLELLLLVMKERHPCFRRQPSSLLQMLCAWHLARLQVRKPDKGPSWLMRQVLQPELLQVLESPAASELLHGIYVYLAGRDSTLQDLAMNHSDIRLGLKRAAGFRSQQEGVQWPDNSRNTGPQSTAIQLQGTAALTAENSMAANSQPGDRSTGGTFYLPLYKVTAFLRTAKLLPRLLEKYITQLQRIGEEQKDRGPPLPVMPLLKAKVMMVPAQKAGVASNASVAGHERFLTASGSLHQQPCLSRMATLQEPSRPLSPAAAHQQQQTGQATRKEFSSSASGSSNCGGIVPSFPRRPGNNESSRLRVSRDAAQPRSSGKSAVSIIGQTAAAAETLIAIDGGSSNNRCSSPPGSAGLMRFGSFDSNSSSRPLTPLDAPPPSTARSGLSALRGAQAALGKGKGSAAAGSAVGANSTGQTQILSNSSSYGIPASSVSAVDVTSSRAGQAGLEAHQVVSKQSSRTVAEGNGMAGERTFDPSVLDTAELVPMRAKTASIIVESELPEGQTQLKPTKGNRVSAMDAKQLQWQLPSPNTLIASIAAAEQVQEQPAGTGQNATVYQHGDSTWREVVQQQEGRGRDTNIDKGRNAGAAAVRKFNSQVSYNQQQASLKQQRRAAAAEARNALQYEQACQDTWTAFVLVEMLGSQLIASPWQAAVKLPVDCAAAETNCAIMAHPLAEKQDTTNSMYCSWDNGYVWHSSCPDGAARTSSSSAAPGGNGGDSSTDHVVDLMHYGITYPQFVEVLLCMMAARSTSLLEPEVKQLRPLVMDGEMQDHTRICLDRINRWRAKQLASGATARKAPLSSTRLSGANSSELDKMSEGLSHVFRLYSIYSNIRAGSPCLGLFEPDYMQLLIDAGITGISGEETDAATSVFKKLVGTTGAARNSKHTTAKDGKSAASGQSASSFMHAVTQQLLQRLAAPKVSATATAAAGANPLCQSSTEAGNSQEQQWQQWQQHQQKQLLQQQQEAEQVQGVLAATCSTAQLHSNSDTSMLQPNDMLIGGPAVLTPFQLWQSLMLLTSKCFSRIANAERAWHLMLDKHLTPLVDRSYCRYDTYQGKLATPGVVALLTAWSQQLQQVFEAAVVAQNQPATAMQTSSLFRSEGQHQQQQQQQLQPQAAVPPLTLLQNQGQPGQQGSTQHAAGLLSIASFLEFLQDRGAIPQLLEPADVIEVLKRLLTQDRQQHDMHHVFSGLSCLDFIHALAMCGLAAFASRRLQGSPAKQPEQQLALFLSHLGLSHAPGQQQLLAQTAAAAAVIGGATARQQQHNSVASDAQQQMAPVDPYAEWWSLEFDPIADNRAHDHLSTLTYMPVVVQEFVVPPAACPEEVLPILTAAQSAHQAREVHRALQLYLAAEQSWREILQHEQQQQHKGAKAVQAQVPQQLADPLPPAAILYLSVSASACLLTAGRDEEAWAVLEGAEHVLRQLHEAGADAALWHAAAGVALYHCQDLQAAFEHCVRAYVIRCECGTLGPGHPDTAAAAHNLGVVLDALGKSSRGLQLLEEAQQVFKDRLGANHIRTLTAMRNAQHMKHKAIKLPANVQQLQQDAAAVWDPPGGYGGPGHSWTHKLRNRKGGTGGYSVCAADSKPQKQTAGAAFISIACADEAVPADKEPPSSTSSSAARYSDSGSSSGRDDGESHISQGVTKSGGLHHQLSSSSTLRSKAGHHSPRPYLPAVGSDSGSRNASSSSMQSRLHSAITNRQKQLSGMDDSDKAQHGGYRYPSSAAVAAAVKQGAQQQQWGKKQQQQAWYEYTHLNHLGQGVFRASLEQRQLYEAMKSDIAAHAHADSSSKLQPGTVELQVAPAAFMMQANRQATAASSQRVDQQQESSDSAVSSITQRAANTAKSVISAGPGRTTAAAGQLTSAEPATTAAAKSIEPVTEPDQACSGIALAHVLRRGALSADATIVAVKKPLSVEQARRLRQQQQQRSKQADKTTGGSLLDKVY